jgi:hypothetical protein
VSPNRLGWPPDRFWRSTAKEFDMAMEGFAGKFRSVPAISREEVAEIARAFGVRPSIRKKK